MIALTSRIENTRLEDAVSHRLAEGIARIGIDDHKRNAMSSAIPALLHRALDRAEQEARAGIISGRPRRGGSQDSPGD